MSAPAQRAFSMIELLVTVAVIAILLALLVPGLGAVRKRGRDSAILATTAQHLAIFAHYSQDFRDMNPWAGPPDSGGRIEMSLPGGVPDRYTTYYFYLSGTWGLLMAGYYDDLWPHPSQQYPRGGQGGGYQYSCAMLADPGYWRQGRPGTRAHLRGTATHEVRYPTLKALLVGAVDYNSYPAFVKDGIGLGFCDASAGYAPRQNLIEPLRRGDGPLPGMCHVRGYFGHDTPNGVLGVDVTQR